MFLRVQIKIKVNPVYDHIRCLEGTIFLLAATSKSDRVPCSRDSAVGTATGYGLDVQGG
jgi:hypothetical protein